MNRCPLCYRRLRGEESQLAHEFSGFCTARDVTTEERVKDSWSEQTKRDVAADERRRHGAPPARIIDREPPAHGTRSRYVSPKWKCKCVLCRKAENDYQTARIKNNPEARAKIRQAQKEWKRRHRAAAR